MAKKQLNIEDIGEKLSSCTTILQGISDIHVKLSQVLGKDVPFDKLKGLPPSLIPDVSVKDVAFVKAVTRAIGGRTYVEKMQAYQSVVEKYASDIDGALRKLEKLNERIKLQTEESPERRMLFVKRAAVEQTIKILAYRIKLCAERWMQCRRKNANLILGMTEKFYIALDKIGVGESIRKYPVSAIYDDIVLADDNKKKKEGK